MTDLISLDGTPAPRFAFGTMQFGGTADEDASRGMIEACIEAGITHFDTANLYTDGASETILGKLIAPLRERLIIATKIGYDAPDSVAALRSQFDASRARLGLDAVDILYLHRFNPNLAMDAQIKLLAALQATGQTRYLALSNFAAWQVMKAQSIALGLGTKIDVVQPMYSLVKRQAEVELLPMCASEGILAATYSPLGGGLLTGKYAKGGTGRLSEDDRYAARYGLDWMHNTAKALPEIAQDLNTHPATLAVAWAAHHSARPAPILSARSLEQLQPSLDALSFEMTSALRAQLTALTPTPAPATDRIEEHG
ncbi:L-glyceraldehyde 3-phosphate reductase [Aliiroseovarius pelagivivens]|uniref:L-glyceraldehyde 3-phosphate reductase n=1 Tax=Aliiroseovarius pelagivivens TaxID=1639690 RepID=A0A2R8AH40_9RHOB|nr:aldo/keto reductase [Aliiroseovarius pelagivivens]SPF75356.1 L-glyceraldehyde 3-phosphate reductase [Aliiroseovarius pelagivivens]